VPQFVYYRYSDGGDGLGSLLTVATYRRTCWR